MPTIRVEPGNNIPGTYRATCTCGWRGTLYGSKGARDAARRDRWRHELNHEDGEFGASTDNPDSAP